MFYISGSAARDNEFLVTDTKDWETERYSAEELMKISENGVSVAGVSRSGVQVFTSEIAMRSIFRKWVLAAQRFPLKITPAFKKSNGWNSGWRLEEMQNLKTSRLDLSSLPIRCVGSDSGNGVYLDDYMKNGDCVWNGKGVEIDTLILPDCVSKVCLNAFTRMKIKHIIFNNKITNFGHDVFYDSGLEDMYLPLDSGVDLFGTFTDCKNLRRVVIDGGNSVSRGIFDDCPALQEVHFGESLKIVGGDRITETAKTDSRLVESKWYCWSPTVAMTPEFLCEHPGDWYFADSVIIGSITDFEMMYEFVRFAKLEHKPRLCIHLMPLPKKTMYLSKKSQEFLEANCNVSVVTDDWQKNFNGIPKS